MKRIQNTMNSTAQGRRNFMRSLLALPAGSCIAPQLLAETTPGEKQEPDSALALAAATMGLISTNVASVMPETTEGPFYMDPKMVRADITDGKKGIPLRFHMQVITADCRPVKGARVDIWHCDAQGLYSAFSMGGGGPRPPRESAPTGEAPAETVDKKPEEPATESAEKAKAAAEGKPEPESKPEPEAKPVAESKPEQDPKDAVFLRGTQICDENGIVTFETIYPGWYQGRTTHIHYKVFLDEKTVLTSQIFFPDALSEYIYEKSAGYKRERDRDTLNSMDGIASQAGEGAYCAVREQKDRYIAAMVVGIDPKANWSERSQGMGRGGRPPGPPAGGREGERAQGPGQEGRPPGPPPEGERRGGGEGRGRPPGGGGPGGPGGGRRDASSRIFPGS